MYVTICGKRLPVVIEDDVRDDTRSPVYGLFRAMRGSHGTVVLDRSLPRTQRRSTIVHEIGHAYDYFLGRVADTDNDGRQNRLAIIDQQFQDDLASQGGEKAIHAMFGDAGEISENSSDSRSMRYVPVHEENENWPSTIVCPHCHEEYPADAVKNGRPALDPAENGFVTPRVLVCGRCHREYSWRQINGHDGPHILGRAKCRHLSA